MKITEKTTSESERELCAQPQPTCPMIDEAKGIIEKCADHIRGYERMDEDQLRSAMSDIESELAELAALRRSFGGHRDGLLEKIRENSEAIRSWGQDWKDYALSLETEPNDAPPHNSVDAETRNP